MKTAENSMINEYTEKISQEPDNPDFYNIRGMVYFCDEDEFEKAILDFSKVIELKKNANAYAWRARCFGKIGKIDNALKDYAQSVEIEPSSDCYSYRASLFESLDKIDEALHDFNKAIELDATRFIALIGRADIYSKEGQYEKAIEDYSKCIETSPSLLRAYTERAYCLGKLGDFNNAIADYDFVIDKKDSNLSKKDSNTLLERRKDLYTKKINLEKLDQEIDSDPNNADIYYQRAEFWKDINHSLALHDLNKSIERDPKHIKALVARAKIYVGMKKNAEAIEDINKAIEINPHSSEVYYLRAKIYDEEKKYVEAINDYSQNIIIDPKNIPAYLRRADIFSEMEKYSNAIDDYTKAIDLMDDNLISYERRAYCYKQTGNIHDAVEDYIQLFKLIKQKNPLHNNIEYLECLFAYGYGRRRDSITDHYKICNTDFKNTGIDILNKALELDPNNIEALLERAEWYLDKNKNSEAIEDCNKIITTQPKNILAYSIRAESYFNENYFIEAIQDYNKIIELEPNNVEAHFRLAEIHTHEFRLLEVIKEYGSRNIDYYLHAVKIERVPQSIVLYIEKATQHSSTEKMFEIIKHYDKVIEIDPEHEKGLAHARRGAAFFSLKDYTKAYDDFIAYRDILKTSGMKEEDYLNIGLIDERLPNEEMANFSYFSELTDEEGIFFTYDDLRKMASAEIIRSEERNKVIQDISHSIKNIISTIIDPLENLKQEETIQPQIIQYAIRGANIVREIVNAINLSYKGSREDFFYDARHADGDDAINLESMFSQSLKHSISNMFDAKYFLNFMRKYFPDKQLFLKAKNDGANLPQDPNINTIVPYLEKYFFHPEIELTNAAQFTIGNEKGSAVKLLIMIQEIILNAVKYAAFVKREDRFIRIYFKGEPDTITIQVENSFDKKVKTKTTGTGHIIIANFAKLLGTVPVITKNDDVYSVKITFKNFWEEASE